MRPALGGLAGIGISNLMVQLRAHVDDLRARATADVKDKAQTFALVAGLALLAGIFALLTVLAGLAVLYVVLAERYGSVTALAVVGASTAVVAVLLLVVAMQKMKSSKPAKAAPIGGFTQSAADLKSNAVNATLDSAVTTMRSGSREKVLGTLALAVVLGIVMGRRG